MISAYIQMENIINGNLNTLDVDDCPRNKLCTYLAEFYNNFKNDGPRIKFKVGTMASPGVGRILVHIYIL